jgi:hypothetical protein
MSVSYGGDSIVFADGSVNSSGFIGHRNRIINGAMVIDQRNAGASVTIPATTVTYTMDRWAAYGSQASKFSVQQNAASVTPPSGFTKYLGVTSLSAYTVGSGEGFWIRQPIEGFNIADLDWGKSTAKTVTLSFWVRSSLTGTFGGGIVDNYTPYSYPFSYTISSANTWEQKTITITGPTSGTFPVDNTAGFYMIFGLGTGSTLSGTAGAWTGANLQNVTGATSVVGTNAATWYITGVQLERGSTASSFEYRPYGTELALCQRYCENIIANGTNPPLWSIQAGSSTNARGGYFYKVQKRASPSFTNLIGTSYISQFASGNFTPSAVNLAASNPNGMLIDSTCTGLTLGQAGFQLEGTLTAGTIICFFTAEL